MGTDLWEVHWVKIDFARIDVMGVDFVRVDLMAPNHVLFSRWPERSVPTFWIRRRNVWRSEEVLISFDVTLPIHQCPYRRGSGCHTQEANKSRRRGSGGEDPTINGDSEDCRAPSTLSEVHLQSWVLRAEAGAAMGPPISAVLANLYMEFFEELALESAPLRPRFWKQYVDNTSCKTAEMWSGALLHHLSYVRPTVKFTMDLPILDTKLTRRKGEALDVVYRKQTHTDWNLHLI